MLETVKLPLKSTFAIASCRDDQRGLRWKNSQHGLFAHFLADAFAGRADRDRNLRISADEAFEYLQSSVQKAAAQSGASQSPMLISPQ